MTSETPVFHSSPHSAPSMTNNSLTAPTMLQRSDSPSLVRRLSQMANPDRWLIAETVDPDLQLSDETIKATGSKLLKDYVRDRLYRHGFLPSDEAWFKEENNNVVNFSVAEIHATDNDDAEDQRRLSVGRSLSRSSSFNSGSRSPSAGRNSLSIDGRLPDSDRAKIGGKRERTVASAPLTIDSVAIHLRRFCLYLERKHASVYREVSRPLNITMSSLDVVRDAFTHVADCVLETGGSERDLSNADRLGKTNDDDGGMSAQFKKASPKWGKIASLFVLTSAFCIDCVVQGHADFLADMLAIANEAIFRAEVVSWIREAGGWSNLVELARDTKKEPPLWHVVVAIWVGLLLALLGTFLFS